jgi:hypothetical protein
MRRLARWLAWWFLLFWLWLGLAGEWNGTEWVAAALAAALAATVADGASAQRQVHFRIRARWLAGAAAVPAAVLVDTAILVAALRRGRQHRGLFHARPTGPRGTGPEVAGRAALLGYYATLSPNAYLVDVDRDTGVALMHELVSSRASERPL